MSGTLKRLSQFAHGLDIQQSDDLALVDYFDDVHERIEALLKSSKAILNIVKKRVSVEKERLKSLHKLTSFIVDETKSVTLQGVLNASWLKLQAHSQQESLHRSKTISSIESTVIQPLSVFLLSDLEKRFQTITQGVRKAVKDYHYHITLLNKSKEKYYSSCSELEAVFLMLYKENGPNWSPTPGHKLYEKEQVIYRKVEEYRQDYEGYVESINVLQQEMILETLPQAITSLHEVSEQMVSVVHSALKNYEGLQVSLLGGMDIELSRVCTDIFIVPDYCCEFLFENMDVLALSIPNSFNFIDYTYKDEALQIQTRKTQYLAMSLLSPKELATRGAMFLAEGDKAKGGGAAIRAPVRMKGLNSLLVETCIEYLQEPLALKEEGLFRVPGDSSVVRSLHSSFLTVGQDVSSLKSAVMEQKDPNNISGLLKLHLRENSLLSSDVTYKLRELLESRQFSLIVTTLAETCSSSELNALSKLLQLMSEMVDEPWQSVNKMTPRTLGIACGLSVFPTLDPGQATQLLEYLIKHSDDLSHCLCR